MATTSAAVSRLATSGLIALTPQQGLEALGQVLDTVAPQVGVMAVDWPAVLAQCSANGVPPLLQEVLRESSRVGGTSEPAAYRWIILHQLEQAQPNERRDLLLAHIQTEVAQVLGFEPSRWPDPQQGFFDLGMDSLMAVNLKNHLQASIERPLPTTLAFDYPTAEALVDYLAKEVLPWEFSSGSAVESQQDIDEREQLAATLEDLTQDEIAALLAQELADIDEDKAQ